MILKTDSKYTLHATPDWSDPNTLEFQLDDGEGGMIDVFPYLDHLEPTMWSGNTVADIAEWKRKVSQALGILMDEGVLEEPRPPPKGKGGFRVHGLGVVGPGPNDIPGWAWMEANRDPSPTRDHIDEDTYNRVLDVMVEGYFYRANRDHGASTVYDLLSDAADEMKQPEYGADALLDDVYPGEMNEVIDDVLESDDYAYAVLPFHYGLDYNVGLAPGEGDIGQIHGWPYTKHLYPGAYSDRSTWPGAGRGGPLESLFDDDDDDDDNDGRSGFRVRGLGNAEESTEPWWENGRCWQRVKDRHGYWTTRRVSNAKCGHYGLQGRRRGRSR
jgi:hypothetical protein